MFIENYGDMKIGNFLQCLISYCLILLYIPLTSLDCFKMAQRLPHQFRTICQSKGHTTT